MLNFSRTTLKDWSANLFAILITTAMLVLSNFDIRGSLPWSYWTCGLAILAILLSIGVRNANEKWLNLIMLLAATTVIGIGMYIGYIHHGAYHAFFLQGQALVISTAFIRAQRSDRKLPAPPIRSPRPQFGPGDAQLLFVLCVLGGTLLAVKSHAGFSPALWLAAACIGFGQVVYVLQRSRSPIAYWVLFGGSATFTLWLAITGRTTVDFFIGCLVITALFVGFEYRFRTDLDAQKRTDPYNVLGLQ